jgi:hypothetical protein
VIQEAINWTLIESSPSPERVGVEVDDSGYEGDVEMYSSEKTRSFWKGP